MHPSDASGKMPRFSMRYPRLVTLIAGLLLLFTADAAWARDGSTTDSSLVRAINDARAVHGLAPVKVDAKLAHVARSHTLDMVRRNYFDHGAFFSRMRASGARGPRFGETIGWEAGYPMSSIIGDWIASAEHRAIVLRAGFRRVGVGALQGTFDGTPGALVVTADFAGS
jgi:uncharacterized protein YkwD